MKKNKSEKNQVTIAVVKNSYCIVLENAGERIKGRGGIHAENINDCQRYQAWNDKK